MRRAGATATLAGVVAIGGCGGGGEAFEPAAEPADSPPVEVRPAGVALTRLGAEAEGLAADAHSGIAAVITREPDELVLLRARGGRVLRRVPLPATGRHLALAAPGGPVLVPTQLADRLVVVSLGGERARSIEVGEFPHSAAAAAGRYFVGNEFGDTLSVVEEGEELRTLPADVQPGGVTAAAGLVSVVAVAQRTIEVFDAETLASRGASAAGEGPTHVVASGDRAFVADTDGDAILEFRLRPEPELVSSTPAVGAPYGIAIDRRRGRIWVTLTETNEAVEYSIEDEGLAELARHPTVRQPNTIAVDERDGSALVAGRTAEGPIRRIGPSEG